MVIFPIVVFSSMGVPLIVTSSSVSVVEHPIIKQVSVKITNNRRHGLDSECNEGKKQNTTSSQIVIKHFKDVDNPLIGLFTSFY